MLPENYTQVESADQIAERQTNYLILRTLENRLDPHLFRTLLNQVAPQMALPHHVSWDGTQLSSNYPEFKVSQTASDEQLLSCLVRSYVFKKIPIFDESSEKNLSQNLMYEFKPTNQFRKQAQNELNGEQNLFYRFHHQLAKSQFTSNKICTIGNFDKFNRLKTVFCHADFQTDEVKDIYNVHFDQKGTFIVSGADDGIIKIWDRQSLTLQASLHGHLDYITELDISKCNKFIASAGKDANIIIWELSTGKLLYKLTHHSKLINCVKFFAPKLQGTHHSNLENSTSKQLQQQYLFSCSDDGTVRLYDFTLISNWATTKQSQESFTSQQLARSSEEDAFRIRRSQRQRMSVSTSNATEQAEVEQLYSIELTPDDFRPGTRNKKLDTLVVNNQGLVVAGSSSGELLVWRLNYELINKRVPKQDCFKFLGQFKMSGRQSCVKFCEFCPKNGIIGVGETLLTGSGDGVINIWNMSVGSWRSNREKDFNLEDKSRLILTIDDIKGCQKTKKIKLDDPDGEEIEYIQDEVLPEGVELKSLKFSKSVCDAVRWSVNGRFAIASVHCQIENQISEFCKIKVWDLVEEKYIDNFASLCGVRLPKNTFVLETHPIFDQILITGSDDGLVCLWNLHTKELIKRFKQYGVYSVDPNIMDNPLHGKWAPDGKAFIFGNSLGTISLYAHENDAHQYIATRVQQFFQFDIQRQNDNPFEKITEKPTICGYNMMPYSVQPERFLIRFTQIDNKTTHQQFQYNLTLAKELGALEEEFYQDKLKNSLFPEDNGNLAIESIQVSAIQPQQLLSPDDDQNMSDLQIIGQIQNRRVNTEVGRQRLQRTNQRITSSLELIEDDSDANSNQSDDEMALSSESLDSESSLSDEPGLNHRSRQRNQPARIIRNPRRAARPRNLRDTETIADDASISEQGNRTRTRTNRSRVLQQSSEDEELQVNSRQIGSVQRNGLRRRQVPEQDHLERGNRRLRRNNQDQSSSPEQVNGRIDKRSRRIEDEEFLPNQNVQRGSSYLSDHELSQEYSDKVDYSSHMLIMASKCSNQPMETNLELQKLPLNEQQQQKIPCLLCKRTEGEIVGPFTKKGGSQDKNYIYLHRDCIEINTYSYFSIQHKKWVNIESMLKHLSNDAQYQCYRCDGYGSTVSCTTCGKNFHGYYCAGIYLLPMRLDYGKPSESTNPQYWQCFFCRDQQNYESAIEQQQVNALKDPKIYLSALKKIEKSHLVTDVNFFKNQLNLQKALTYQPQIDDVLLYFFQGHEDYIYQYNCHFFAGQSATYPKRQTMPWFASTELKGFLASQEVTLCKVISIQTLFPSQRSLNLIQQFGTGASECVQTPQMIQRIELQLIENQQKFFIDLFPNELPDFLVLYQVFDYQQRKFREQSYIGKEVNVRLKSRTQKVKIIEESPVEATFCPKSQWQTILCSPIQAQDINQRGGRSSSTQNEQTIRINFWDIIFDNQAQLVHELNGFNEHEHIKLKQFLQNYMTKKKEYLVYFQERVQEKIAPDYRQIIPQEMWFDLLLSRLQNKYYRSNRQFFADLQQIALNAEAYNGKHHDIAIDATAIVTNLKMDTMRLIDSFGDRQLKDRVQEAGKLTAPSKINLKNHTDIERQNNNSSTNKRQQQVQNMSELYEESKEIDYDQNPQKLGNKRSRPNQKREDSPEMESFDQRNLSASSSIQDGAIASSRTLRKRQRQL